MIKNRAEHFSQGVPNQDQRWRYFSTAINNYQPERTVLPLTDLYMQQMLTNLFPLLLIQTYVNLVSWIKKCALVLSPLIQRRVFHVLLGDGQKGCIFHSLQPSVRTALDIRDSPNYSGCFNLFFPAKDLSHHILLSTVRRPNMICLKVKNSNCNNLQNYKNVKRYQFSISKILLHQISL